MKNIIIQIQVILFSFNLSAQTNYTGLQIPYVPCSPCTGTNVEYQATLYFSQPNQVASDFGPRYIKRENKPHTPYDWHGGIDYSHNPNDGDNDKGFHLKSIVDGRVHAIVGGNLKAIIIDGISHDFGYLHIFESGTNLPQKVGNCYFVELDNSIPTNRQYGILIPNQNSYILLSTCPSGNCNSRKYTHNNITYTATDSVVTGQVIAVLGDSGTGGAHLHLNRYESLTNCTDYANCDEYMLNPLEHVEHTGVNYACTFHNHSEPKTNPSEEPVGFSNDHIVYPGTKSSTIMVRPQLVGGGNGNHYTAGTFNIRDVSLEIKPTIGGSYRQFKGSNYESKIFMGSTDFYPEAYPKYINKSTESSQGGWSKQGIYNFAYRDAGDPHRGPYTTSGGRPYDDFYFPFYHRLHKSSPLNGGELKFTDVPTNARYNDGSYLLRARVTDVRNVYTDIETNLTLDNFLPYLTEVNIKYNGDPLHQTLRVGDEGSAKADDGYIMNQIHEYPIGSGLTLPNTLTIEIKTSGPIQNIKMAYVKEPFDT